MKLFIDWHKSKIKCAADYFNLSQYQLLWVAAIKGFIMGYIVSVYL